MEPNLLSGKRVRTIWQPACEAHMWVYLREHRTVRLQTSFTTNVTNKYVEILLLHKFLLYNIPQKITDPIMFHANKNRLPYVTINLGTVTIYRCIDRLFLRERHEILHITSTIISMFVYAPTTKYIFILIFNFAGYSSTQLSFE